MHPSELQLNSSSMNVPHTRANAAYNTVSIFLCCLTWSLLSCACECSCAPCLNDLPIIVRVVLHLRLVPSCICLNGLLSEQKTTPLFGKLNANTITNKHACMRSELHIDSCNGVTYREFLQLKALPEEVDCSLKLR